MLRARASFNEQPGSKLVQKMAWPNVLDGLTKWAPDLLKSLKSKPGHQAFFSGAPKAPGSSHARPECQSGVARPRNRLYIFPNMTFDMRGAGGGGLGAAAFWVGKCH